MRRISAHLIRVFTCMEKCSGYWKSVADVMGATAVARCTANKHLRILMEMKLVTRVETFGGYMYRMVENPGISNPEGYAIILQAKDAMRVAA